MPYPQYTISVALVTIALAATALIFFRSKVRTMALSILLGFLLTIPLDVYFFKAGIWDVDPAATLGLRIGILPVEEFGYIAVWGALVMICWEYFGRKK